MKAESSRAPYYVKLHLGDYARDADHLSMLQEGAYFRLMRWYYSIAKPLPNDMERIYRRCMAFSIEEQQAIRYILEEFFVLDGPVWLHKRIEQELEDWSAISEMASNSAKGRASPGLYRSQRSARLGKARLLGTHSDKEWSALLNVCRFQCVACEDRVSKLEKDHIIPLYQGGPDSIDNIQPLCTSCNRSKGPETTDYRPSGWKEQLLLIINGNSHATAGRSHGERPANQNQNQNQNQEPLIQNIGVSVDKSVDKWWKTDKGVKGKGAELGIQPTPGENYAAYRDRLFASIKAKA